MEKGAPQTLREAATYDTITLHDDLTIDRVRLSISDVKEPSGGVAPNVVFLAPDAGDNASLTTMNNAQIGQNAGNGGGLIVGANGGWGTVTLGDCISHKDCFRMKYITISENAAVPDGTPVFFKIGKNNQFNLKSFKHDSAKPIKILFDGGYMSSSDGDNNKWFATSKETGSITLEGVNGNPVHFSNMGHKTRYFCDNVNHKGMIYIDGDCDFVVEGNDNQKMIFDQPNVCFRNAGNFLACEKVIVRVNNVLPVGETVGDFVLTNITEAAKPEDQDFPYLDIYGCTNAVNSLYQASVAEEYFEEYFVTNSHATRKSVLRLGTARDGRFNAKVIDGVIIEQVGHEIALDKAVMPEYHLRGGTLRVTRDSEIAKLICEANTKIVIDGTMLKVGTFVDEGVIVECVNGGKLEVPNIVEWTQQKTGLIFRAADSSAFDGDGTLVKVGADTMIVNPTKSFPLNLDVKEGTLKFAGAKDYSDGCTNEWWRWTIKGTQGGDLPNISSIGLFAPTEDASTWTSVLHNWSVRPAPEGTAATDLERGQSCVPAHVAADLDTTTSDKYTGLTELFSGAQHFYFTTRTIIPKRDDPSTWIPVTFRIYPAKIIGFSIRAGWAGGDKWTNAFTLETSVNGVDWEVVLDVKDAPLTRVVHWFEGDTADHDAYYALPDGDPDKNPNSPLLKQRDYCPRPLPIRGYGETQAGLADGVNVKVAEGATLDLSNVADEASAVSSITVDGTQGGGTIIGMSAGAGGSIRIENAPDALPAVYSIPFILTDAVNASNFGTWKIYVNGTEKGGRRLSYSDGAFHVKATGSVIIVR